MIPWLQVAELIGRSGKSLADLLSDRMAAFPSSGEINFHLNDPESAIARVESAFADQSPARDEMDGLSLTFNDWRLNLRRSNTEPLLRLNVEARGGVDLAARVLAVKALIEGSSLIAT
jgi:phosphomannomutase